MHSYWVKESRKHLIFIVHGGGFVKGNFDSIDEIEAKNLAGMFEERGFDVVITNYTLATPDKASFPGVLWDIQRCLTEVRAKLNPLSVTMIGTSAGATIALMSTGAYLMKNKPQHQPADRLALFYGIYDFENHQELAVKPFNVTEGLRQFIGAPLSLAIEDLEKLRPGTRTEHYNAAEAHFRWRNPIRSEKLEVFRNTPMLIVHGRDDQVVNVNQSRALVDGLLNTGHQNVTFTMPSNLNNHGFKISSMIDAITHLTFSGKTKP